MKIIDKAGSVPRNSLLARHLREFPNPPNVDAGEGVPMMFAQMEQAKLYEPLYREQLDGAVPTLLVTDFVELVSAGNVLVVAAVKFGSRAKKLGVEQGYKVVELKLPNPARPSSHWVFIPAALLGWGVWWLQGLRLRRERRKSGESRYFN